MQRCNDCGLEATDLTGHECAPRGTWVIKKKDKKVLTYSRTVDVMAGATEAAARDACRCLNGARWHGDTYYVAERVA